LKIRFPLHGISFFQDFQGILSTEIGHGNVDKTYKKTSKERIETVIDVVCSIDRKTDGMESCLRT